MNVLHPAPLLLAPLLALACAGTALAQDAKGNSGELAQARAELARAAKRVSELSTTEGLGGLTALSGKPVLGVLLAADEDRGVLISGVTPDGAAAKAGLSSGDRLLGVDGKPIAGTDGSQRLAAARDLLRHLQAGQPVTLEYLRGGKTRTASVTPKVSSAVALLQNLGGEGQLSQLITLSPDKIGRIDVDVAALADLPLGLDKNIALELKRSELGDCGDESCRQPLLVEAFRWQGLNLASVDAQLGRYFGTDRGVLVLSTGKELTNLQAGDVIGKVDGVAVNTPREVMSALRAKPAQSKVTIDYLRDRRPGSAQISVPKALPLHTGAFPAFSATSRAPLMLALPANPARPAAPSSHSADTPVVITQRRILTVDQDGNVLESSEPDTASPRARD